MIRFFNQNITKLNKFKKTMKIIIFLLIVFILLTLPSIFYNLYKNIIILILIYIINIITIVLVLLIDKIKHFEKSILIIKTKGINFDIIENIIYNDKALLKNIGELYKYLKTIIIKNYKFQILKNQAEINALQSQINPHFLYNTLDAIRGQALIEKNIVIAEMIESLSIMFRYSISKKNEMASLREELNNIDNYLKIQQYRFKNKFIITKSIELEYRMLDIELPRLTIQPIIENAIYHGLEMKRGESKINIRMINMNDKVIIRISDNGIGIEEKKLDQINLMLNSENDNSLELNQIQQTGVALQNVNKRLKLCFGIISGLKIYSTFGIGTDVEFLIPKEKFIESIF